VELPFFKGNKEQSMGKKPKKEIKPKKVKPSQLVYQLLISIIDIEPPIWRRIQVTGDTKLDFLHAILQTTMGWFDEHLHEFEIRGKLYTDPSTSMDEPGAIDEKTVNLAELLPYEEEKFLYVYDLGDWWRHDILVEKILPREKGTRYPVCLEGSRACPPEDCGGTSGYAELLEALGDPSHEEHEAMFDWLQGDFDSEKFDIEYVNKKLGGF